MLWLVILWPQDFPRTLAEWARSDALIAFGARAAVQLLLVLICFGIGRGIGGVLGSLPPFPLMLPIGISFLAIPLARLVWDPRKAQAMDELLDDALAQIEAGPAKGTPEGDRDYAEAVTTPLNGLADDVSEAELNSHLSALRALVDEALTFDVLASRVEKGSASAAGKRALMVMASDGPAIERMGLPNAPLRAMQALGQDPDLVARLAERLVIALRQDPEIWNNCPNVGALEAMRTQFPQADAALLALEDEIMAQAPRG